MFSSHRSPGNAPAGDYTYNGMIGNYPNPVYVSDSFPFEKQPGEVFDTPYGDWRLTGWCGESMLATLPVPDSWSLGQNYPNPFNPITTITFTLPETNHVRLSIFNLQGKKVEELVNGTRVAGYHEVIWDASGLPCGIYFYKIEAGNYHSAKKMVLLK